MWFDVRHVAGRVPSRGEEDLTVIASRLLKTSDELIISQRDVDAGCRHYHMPH
jgi:hypothetical protein